ncbi:MAG: arginase family protein [Cyanobacteria bacterium SZAS LIN-3]|nr:arginase family protein [Cyanobacteria bacterium SZAS LIN-3]
MSSSAAKNYFGLSADHSGRDSSRVAVIPVPYEGSGVGSKGTKDAPKAILEASQQVELFDDELWIEPFKIGVHTAPAVKFDAVTNESAAPFQELADAVRPFIDGDKFPIIVGGERTVSLGAVKGCIDRYPSLSVLQLGAHCNLRASCEGNDYSGASAAFQVYKTLPNPRITQVGVRNVSWDEVAWMEEDEPQINIFWARHKSKWDYNEIINTLSDNVYLSINVNVLDCGVMAATGEPEPGGIDWYQLMEVIKMVCVRKNVVGADLTELAPIKGVPAPNFVAAKLLYKLIGYRFALDLGVTKKYL